MQDSNPEGLWNPIFSRVDACWQPTELLRIKLKKLEFDSPSLWSASIQPTRPHWHLAFAPGSGNIHICCCSFRCFGTGKRFLNQKETSCLPLLNAGFEPRGSLKPNLQQTECLMPNRLSYRGSSLKNLSSTARAYDQQALSPSDPTAIWHSHLALAIYIFVVVHFDALAQASDFRIKRRQVVFLCWMQDSNPEVLWNPIFSRLYACWQTDWAIEDQAKKLELDSPSLWSASIQPTWAHWHLAFAPGSGDIHICCC